MILEGVMAVLALTELTLVLVPLILAFIFTATLEPLVTWIVARGRGRGVAAAISLETGVTPRKVDIRRVQDALRAQGVRLD